MCGRIDIQGERLSREIRELLGFNFHAPSNRDLRPTQAMQAIVSHLGQLDQLEASWGIKPSWSKQLLINAKAETVDQKPTFKQAFRERRCILPCSGWFEWRDEGGPKKQKYHFQHVEGSPLLMAAIWYPPAAEEGARQLVTLTTAANSECAEYHTRMPLLIRPQDLDVWLGEQAMVPLSAMIASGGDGIRVVPVKA
ncbi:MAG: putative SOS response-associated peptidase YedK [Motiliproteus sp.]|jgi:putative SOS response-associated peptidase YedK